VLNLLIVLFTYRGEYLHCDADADADVVYIYILHCVQITVGFLAWLITGPPKGPVLFCSLSSSSSVTLLAGGPAVGRVGGRAADTARRASTVTSRLGDILFKLKFQTVKLREGKPSHLVAPLFSFFTCSERETLGIIGIGFYRLGALLTQLMKILLTSSRCECRLYPSRNKYSI